MQALRLGTLLDRASMTVPARESICQQWHYARHDTWWKASPCTASACQSDGFFLHSRNQKEQENFAKIRIPKHHKGKQI
jgi:hypothetical protein